MGIAPPKIASVASDVITAACPRAVHAPPVVGAVRAEAATVVLPPPASTNTGGGGGGGFEGLDVLAILGNERLFKVLLELLGHLLGAHGSRHGEERRSSQHHHHQGGPHFFFSLSIPC